jgi:hypothetical protein
MIALLRLFHLRDVEYVVQLSFKSTDFSSDFCSSIRHSRLWGSCFHVINEYSQWLQSLRVRKMWAPIKKCCLKRHLVRSITGK